MSRIFVCGTGAVSPAGWDVEAMCHALHQGVTLPIVEIKRPGYSKPLRTLAVPPSAKKQPFLSHPRLRRSSPITHYAASATLEAVTPLMSKIGLTQKLPLGLIFCLNAGCVQYSCRFWEEVTQNPTTASPLLFPETVFAAAASHVSSLLAYTPAVSTLIGDPGTFLQGVSLAVDWLESKTVDACIVVGAEEVNWLLADALWHLEPSALLSGGAGALCLTLNSSWSNGVELTAITDSHTMNIRGNRNSAAIAMRREFPPFQPGDLLCTGIGASKKGSAPELVAWQDWDGARISPKQVLGEGLMAAAAWQCVTGIESVIQQNYSGANVSIASGSQQAIGARFEGCSSA